MVFVRLSIEITEARPLAPGWLTIFFAYTFIGDARAGRYRPYCVEVASIVRRYRIDVSGRHLTVTFFVYDPSALSIIVIDETVLQRGL